MLSVFISLTFISSASGQTCLALAIEGGGSKGAYEAGVLYSMANSSKNINMAYNIVTGVSVGAINAGLATNYPIGQEKAMVQYMVDFWNSLYNTSQIYTDWPNGGDLTGLLFEGGLYTNAPAVELGKKWVTGARQRGISCGSANLDTGLFGTFNESVGAAIVDAITASASVPFFFPQKEFEGFAWADGGGVINIDLESGILRCLKITANQRNIIVDQLYDDYSTSLPVDTSFKTQDVFQRMYEINSHDSAIWYSYNAMQAYPNVNYRYTIIPSVAMGQLLNFSRAVVQYNLNLGYKDGKALFGENAQQQSAFDVLLGQLKRTSQIVFP
jgi:predicted patatin/cPLA2 family phospholipase